MRVVTGTATQPSQTQPSQTQAEGEEEDDHSDMDDLDADEPGPSQVYTILATTCVPRASLLLLQMQLSVIVQPTRISSRHRGKRPRYAEAGNSGSDAEAIEEDDSDEEEATQKLPKLSQQGTPSQTKRRKRCSPT